jgi:hypothetical protein
MKIMPKHEGQATVASFDSQKRQRGESQEIDAPQFGQFRVSAFIFASQALPMAQPKINIAGRRVNWKNWTSARSTFERNRRRMNEIGAWSQPGETGNLKAAGLTQRFPAELGSERQAARLS